MSDKPFSWLRLGASLASSVVVLVYFHWWQERMLHPATTPPFMRWLWRSATLQTESLPSANATIVIDIIATRVCRVRRESGPPMTTVHYVCDTCGETGMSGQKALDHVAASKVFPS